MASAASRALAMFLLLFRSGSDAKKVRGKAANKPVRLLKQHRPPFRAKQGGAVTTTVASFAQFGVGSGRRWRGANQGQKGWPAGRLRDRFESPGT